MKEKKGTMTVEEAGHLGGQKERKLVREGEKAEGMPVEKKKKD